MSKLQIKGALPSNDPKVNEIIDLLLENRGIFGKEKKQFLEPDISQVTLENLDFDVAEVRKAVKRIQLAQSENEQIVIYGDYDVDGICATAILWEILNGCGLKVLPYIPHREDEGYGLSQKGIANVKSQIPDVKLIITVDNGIVANEAVDFAKDQGIDVIITDHHQPAQKLPKAEAIVHSTKLCGAGVAWLFAKQLSVNNLQFSIDNSLDLVALATIADMVPVTGANRAILKEGLKVLNSTKRVGLLALIKEAGIIPPRQIGTYEASFLLAPRINAMGRMEFAMDSLRLICTKDKIKAKILAQKLNDTNRDRQMVTEETVLLAKSKVINQSKIGKLLFISDETFQQGVIGLVAGKLVEEYYRPSIVVSVGSPYSKASARSVAGFNITEFMRSASDLLVNVGGHPMAGGFTVETSKLKSLEQKLQKLAEETVSEEHLAKVINVDCELPLSSASISLGEAIAALEPFGIGNPNPVFISEGQIADIRTVGAEGKHLSLFIKDIKSNYSARAIAFNQGEKAKELAIGDKVKLVYCLEVDSWNGQKRVQLKVKTILT